MDIAKKVSQINVEISVIIPCRNEAAYISACLKAVLSFDMSDGLFEILVVDGMSTDGTREIIAGYAAAHPIIKLLDNPAKIAPAAMNIGIKAAAGAVIVRLDAHSEYPRSYVHDCVALMKATGAGNAGGRLLSIPNGTGPWAVPVGEVTKHKFGVGSGAFRVGTQPGLVDTVPFGTFRREVFEKVGLYDERLTRNQDNEFNDRLRQAGYKIAFDPSIEISYKNQATLSGLLHQAFHTGAWNVYTLKLHPYTFKWRRFIPVAFVVYLLSIPFVCYFIPSGWAYLLPWMFYVFIAIKVSVGMSYKPEVTSRIAVTFVSYHISYGAGTLAGIANILTGKWKKHLGLPLRI